MNSLRNGPAPSSIVDGALPRPRTRFFGREAELQRVMTAMETASLVTIVGAPGMGKTRLAIELAARLTGPIAYASLADVNGMEEAQATIARALGQEATTGDLAELLAGAGTVIVILDEAEHLASTLSSHLRSLPATARILCTSRVKLACTQEVAIELGPLSTEDALALLADRAGARFGATHTDRDVLVNVVERSDRVPLAIELLASRAKILTPQELLARLDSSLAALRNDELDGRHARLETAIDASFHALPGPMQRALAFSSVFRGGFSLDAFERIVLPLTVTTTEGGTGGVDASLHVVDVLCSASLLAAFDAPPAHATTRFAPFATIRAYAWEQLDEADRTRASLAHLAYFSEWARSLDDRMRASAAETVALIALEAANMRTAFETAIATGSEEALHIALALAPLKHARGSLELHERQLDRALAVGTGDLRLQARAIVARAHVRFSRGSTSGALGDLATAQRIVDATGHGDIESELLTVLTIVMQSLGQLDEGVTLLEAKLERSECPDLVLRSLGVMFISRGELERALEAFTRALVHARERADANHVGGLLALVGMTHQELGDLARARAALEDAMRHAERIGDRFILAVAKNWFGQVLIDDDDLTGGRCAIEEARAILAELGDSWFHRATLGYLGILDHCDGDLERARTRLTEAVALATREGDHYRLGTFQPHLAAVLAALGDPVSARAAFAEARVRAVSSPCPNLLPIASVLESFVDASTMAARIDRGRVAARRSSDVRLALRVVERLSASHGVERQASTLVALSAARTGAWFAIGRAARCDLGRRVPLRRILECLVAEHTRAPGIGVSSARILAAGWPGEHVQHDAGLHRVHVAIATLRRLGLGDLLLKQSDGYLIDSAVDVVIVDESTAPLNKLTP